MATTPPDIKTSGLARQIAEEAAEAGAGRVAFRRDATFYFATTDAVSIHQVLEGNSPEKFKLQVRSESRWVDATRYRLIDTGKHVYSALRKGDLGRLNGESPDIIARAAESDPDTFSVALRGLHRHLFGELNRDPASPQVARAHRFFESQTPLHDEHHVDFMRATVALYSVLVERGLAKVLRGAPTADMVSALQAHIDANSDRFSGHGAQIAAANLLGKVYSLDDRSAAAGHFEQVRRLDERGVIEHFYHEAGSKTYFSAQQVDAGIPGGADQIRKSMRSVEGQDPTNKFGILIAMDPGFYRTYAPMLRFYAQQMPDIDYNFLICGPEPETHSAIDDGDDYSRALMRLNRSGHPPNVHHFHVPVPTFAVEQVTFYACARFFAAQMMLERYATVYLMDADLATDIDPRPYLQKLRELSFAVPSMTGYAAMHPWRRYLAGNVVLSRDVLETPVLSDLQGYLAHGLRAPHSWTLDQNALTYAIERNPERYTDLRTYGRPFYQPKFRMVWERRFRELAQTP